MPRTKSLRPVDRVDDPAPGAVEVADQPVLLAEQAMVRAVGEHAGGDGQLGIAVGLGDLGAVRLPVEVERAVRVVRQRDGSGQVGQFQGERELGCRVEVGDRHARRLRRPADGEPPGSDASAARIFPVAVDDPYDEDRAGSISRAWPRSACM